MCNGQCRNVLGLKCLRSEMSVHLIAVCSKINQHVQMKVAERGVSNSDEEF